jgi:hypothetical protein
MLPLGTVVDKVFYLPIFILSARHKENAKIIICPLILNYITIVQYYARSLFVLPTAWPTCLIKRHLHEPIKQSRPANAKKKKNK